MERLADDPRGRDSSAPASGAQRDENGGRAQCAAHAPIPSSEAARHVKHLSW